MDISIIADEDTLLGFALAGIKNGILFNPDTLKEDLKSIENSKVLIVTEKVAGYMREKNMKVQPTLAEIPDKNGSTGNALKEISRLFESAIGVALKEEN